MATQIPALDQFTAPALAPVERDTLTKIFFGAVDRHNRRDALMYKEAGAWRPLSHREVERRVTQLAAALAARGVERGDRIALLSENRPEWAITDYAAQGLGAMDVPIYTTLPGNQIAYILNDCEAKAIFVSTREQLDKVLEIIDEVPSLQAIVIFDDVATTNRRIEHFSDLLKAGQREIDAGRFANFRERALAAGRDDVATLIYTSGTTGAPKGVMLTHYNLASNVAAGQQQGTLVTEPGDVALSFLPLSHVFERMVDYVYWDAGVSIAYAESIDSVAENLLEISPHMMVSVPRVFEKIYARVMSETGIKKKLILWAKKVGEGAVEERLAGREPSSWQLKLADRLVFSKLRARTGGRIRFFVSGGAPLSADVARFFFAAGLPVYEGYGLTETSPVIAVNRPGGVKLGTVGPVLVGEEVRISEEGEILARGPNIMKGYWNDPEATAEVIDADGWLHTGDIGTLDADGFLTITDRLKNLIVTAGGKNIAPQPIENEATMSPYVAQALMIGDKRPYGTLLVVPDWDNLAGWAREQGITLGDRERAAKDPRVRELLERETLGHLAGLARFETPKKIAIIPNEFTIDEGLLTPTLKIRRRAVEERYRDVIEGMYAG
jgi:long-chain acyl-CoA synthetase